jgi:hypothetical protein
MDEIIIDEGNQAIIREIIRTINELQGRLNLTIQVILNARGAKGTYILSDDLTKLIRVQTNEDTVKAEILPTT